MPMNTIRRTIRRIILRIFLPCCLLICPREFNRVFPWSCCHGYILILNPHFDVFDLLTGTIRLISQRMNRL
jgi:hypothetical protein